MGYALGHFKMCGCDKKDSISNSRRCIFLKAVKQQQSNNLFLRTENIAVVLCLHCGRQRCKPSHRNCTHFHRDYLIFLQTKPIRIIWKILKSHILVGSKFSNCCLKWDHETGSTNMATFVFSVCVCSYRVWHISLLNLQGQDSSLLLLCIWRINTWEHNNKEVLFYTYISTIMSETLESLMDKNRSSNTFQLDMRQTVCVQTHSGVLVSRVSGHRSPVLHSGCPMVRGRDNSLQPRTTNWSN